MQGASARTLPAATTSRGSIGAEGPSAVAEKIPPGRGGTIAAASDALDQAQDGELCVALGALRALPIDEVEQGLNTFSFSHNTLGTLLVRPAR